MHIVHFFAILCPMKKKDTKNTMSNIILKKKEEIKKESKEKSKGVKKVVIVLGEQLMWVIFIFAAILISYKLFFTETKKGVVPLSVAMQAIQEGAVEAVHIKGDLITLTKKDTTEIETKKEYGSSIGQVLNLYGVSSSTIQALAITVDSDRGISFWLSLLPMLIPVLFLVLMLWWLGKGIKGSNMQALSFGQSRAKIIYPDDGKQKILFKDVAGAKEAKEELGEIVDFLKSPQKFLDIGAEIPKGVLLMGEPGTGKTMLARAVAGEAGVPFFHLSGSEFEEMFVGVGASRVRDLFAMAKKESPAIIFIDEIDAVGRSRSSSIGGAGEGREQTLNQILVEMDGFEPTQNLIVMAATNRADVLDVALLRPGRFDRRVTLDLPDRKDREEILRVHIKEKPLADDVNFAVIAERTPGFSGADLYSLMNEGAILAAREGRKTVMQYDLIRSIEKVMLGPERKSHMLSKEEKKITAYHEAGHALVASCLPYADPVHKISIISRGNAGGYTLKLPFDEKRLMSRKSFLDDIAMSLGGYVAELEVFGDLTTGPSNDLKVSTNMARAMITKYGMGSLGPVAFIQEEMGAFGRNKNFSENYAMRIDDEVSKVMHEALARATTIVKEKRNVLNVIAEELMKVETIEREAFEAILKAEGIEVKKRD